MRLLPFPPIFDKSKLIEHISVMRVQPGKSKVITDIFALNFNSLKYE
jgi:hypothetical protein